MNTKSVKSLIPQLGLVAALLVPTAASAQSSQQDYFCQRAVSEVEYYSQYSEDIGCSYTEDSFCWSLAEEIWNYMDLYFLFECGPSGYTINGGS